MGLFWILCGGLLYLARANEMEIQTSEKNNSTATLEEEMDNQENVLTQLLGDYDKVKTLSEGSDCRCKCVVKPLSRSACARVEEGRAEPEDFYTVETVTAGPDCRKCVCMAPPSALNPCEGDFRFRKLQEAAKNDIKLSSIMDLLEGASYGMDLLKLHSVTTKLLERIEKIEQSFSVNQTKERWSLKEEKLQVKSPRLHQRQEKKKRLSIDAPLLQKNEAAAFAHKEKKYEEKFVGIQANKSVFKRVDHDDHEELKESIKAKEVPSNKTIRRMTFYKSNTIENKDGDVHTAHELLSGDGSVDLIFEDQLHKQDVASPVQRPDVTAAVTQTPTFSSKSKNSYLTYSSTSPEGEILNRNTSNSPANITETILPITSTNRVTTITPLRIPNTTLHTGKNPTKMSKLSWDEPTAQPKTQLPKKQGICKDTLASIAEPVTHNTYGKSAGSWMKDPKGNGKVIYVTDFYYGNTLLEFRDLDVFKQGQFSNFYKLPYNWLGTGHVVYSGSFFYNRAFSRDIIRFDLRLRYVAAWTTLHDAITQEEEEVPSDLERQSEIDFGVDESGLWVVYPALDEEGFHQEVIILSKLRPSDLQKEKIWRTGLRRHYYGNCFVICGVLYAVDSVERTYANISYAFDTHTHTQMIPRLPFINNYTYTTQIDYNPKERMLYSWDNGHQVTYNVIFAY